MQNQWQNANYKLLKEDCAQEQLITAPLIPAAIFPRAMPPTITNVRK